MTPEQKQIEEFVKGQAGIEYTEEWMAHPYPIAAVRWGPSKFFWAVLGGIDQSSLHVLRYDELIAPHKLGVQIMLDGEMIAYLAPWPEWHDDTYDRVELAKQFERRDKALADPETKRQFDEFFREGIG